MKTHGSKSGLTARMIAATLFPRRRPSAPSPAPPFACTRSMPSGMHLSQLSKASFKLASGLRTRIGIDISCGSVVPCGTGAHEAESNGEEEAACGEPDNAYYWHWQRTREPESEECVHHLHMVCSLSILYLSSFSVGAVSVLAYLEYW
jgi:hypothetical protein